mgnify:CR=1 FL=1
MKSVVLRKFAIVVPILIIFILATVSPFQIHFEDVLTLTPATEYGVDVSIWRILFEPILGPLLYLNRSLYVLAEVPFVFLWVLIFYLAFSVLQILRKQSRRKKVFYTKLTNLLLIIGICFTVFVVILFVPLPNNTIVNNSKDSVLVTTHAHTEFSHDGLISQKGMWNWHKRNGFDAFFITDHANHKKSLQFAKEQKSGSFPIAPLVLVGQEYSGTNHMSLLGLNGKFETEGMKDKAVIDSVHRYGGAVIINHWFDGKGKPKELYNELGADGFEIENTATDLYYNRNIYKEIKKFCEENELIMIGGLDFHGYGKVCSLYNAFEIPNWSTMDYKRKENRILDILKNGPQEKVKVLLYKDRPFYSKSNLFFRPFLTVVNYFRTLNLAQVLSWAFWLVVFRFMGNHFKQNPILKNNLLLFLSFLSAIFLIVLGVNYYFKGKAVEGYSEVYSEYSLLLGPIGFILLLYVLAIGYFRFSALTKSKISKNG